MSGNYRAIKAIYLEYFCWHSKLLRQDSTLAYINLFFVDSALEKHGSRWEVIHRLYRNKE